MAEKRKSTLAQIMGRMTDVEHQEIKKNFFGLIYGALGVGKSVLITGIAQVLKGDGEILYLDSAQGAAVLDNHKKLKKDVNWISVTDPRDLMTIASGLKTRKGELANVKVVLLDEVDSWFEKILHAYVRDKYGIPSDQDLPDIEGKDYNTPTAIMINIVNTFLSVDDLHVIMVAHEQERGKEPKIFTAPSLPPKLMRGINEKVHLVARLEAVITKDGYNRTLQVNPTKQIVAKTRIGGLDVKVPFGQMPKIIKNWVGSSDMESSLTSKHPDPEPVADEDVDTEEVDDTEVEDEEAVEVE